MKIPIKNLYYIFCYAWASFPQGELVEVGDDDAPTLQNLFAKILIDGLHKIVRRGLARGYVPQEDDLRVPRGRLLLDEIIKRQTLLKGQATCLFEEFQSDILKNQIIKATARILCSSPSLEKIYQHELRFLVRSLDAVSDIRLSVSVFRRIQISRNDRAYKLLIKLCEFIFRSSLPEEGGTGSRFADVLEDEVTMSTVFEDFLRNFFAHEQSEFAVSRDRYLWDAIPLSEGGGKLLPVMDTDIVLRSPSRTIVADAKYYREMLRGRDQSIQKINSANLYQLFSYLHHARLRELGQQVHGMLIYPSVGCDVLEDYEIAGSRVRIATVNLNKDWQEIHTELLRLLHPIGDEAQLSYHSSDFALLAV